MIGEYKENLKPNQENEALEIQKTKLSAAVLDISFSLTLFYSFQQAVKPLPP